MREPEIMDAETGKVYKTTPGRKFPRGKPIAELRKLCYTFPEGKVDAYERKRARWCPGNGAHA